MIDNTPSEQLTSPRAHSSDREPGDFSALLSIYHRVDPRDLTWALASLHQQSQPAEEVVIVLDGPVGDELRGVIKKFEESYPYTTKVIELANNIGSAGASNAGLEHCSYGLIARLDADDIAKPGRFQAQAEFMNAHPEVAVLGSALEEFRSEELATREVRIGDMDADLGVIRGLKTKIRQLPEQHPDIVKAARINSPVNHPSTMLRAEAIRDVGAYQHVHFMEDYDLWARIIRAGYRLHNDPQAWTWFRTSDAMFARRSGKEMWSAEIQMQRNLVQYGLIGYPRAILNFVLRSAFRALPQPLLAKAYKLIFQRSAD